MMSKNVYNEFLPDRFFEHEPSDQIVCGECANEAVSKTLKGEYKGDEACRAVEYRLLRDDDTEPYQCDTCNKQNDAYEDADFDD